MSLAVRLRVEPVRDIAFGAIAVGYMGVGTAIDNPARMIFIQNLTDAALMFSFNGVDDHFPLPANGYVILDIASNQSNVQGLFLSEGDRLYVKQLAVPTAGSVYFTSFYGLE